MKIQSTLNTHVKHSFQRNEMLENFKSISITHSNGSFFFKKFYHEKLIAIATVASLFIHVAVLYHKKTHVFVWSQLVDTNTTRIVTLTISMWMDKNHNIRMSTDGFARRTHNWKFSFHTTYEATSHHVMLLWVCYWKYVYRLMTGENSVRWGSFVSTIFELEFDSFGKWSERSQNWTSIDTFNWYVWQINFRIYIIHDIMWSWCSTSFNFETLYKY